MNDIPNISCILFVVVRSPAVASGLRGLEKVEDDVHDTQ